MPPDSEGWDLHDRYDSTEEAVDTILQLADDWHVFIEADGDGWLIWKTRRRPREWRA